MTMMTNGMTKFAALLGTLALVMSACAEPEIIELSPHEPDSTESKLASVTPEFRVHGLDEMPQELLLEQLGLSVSEIRLEPLRGDRGVAYTTSNPLQLTFDISEGQEALRGETVAFPETGRFLVSIRLEPTEMLSTLEQRDDDQMEGSLNLEGKVRSEFLATEEERQEGDDNDGNPLPLPVHGINDDDDGMWTPFSFTSQRVVFYTFSDVELVAGEQVLAFSFDLNDWATEVINPLIDAVERIEADGVIDVTQEMDGAESGPEAILDSGTVSTTLVE